MNARRLTTAAVVVVLALAAVGLAVARDRAYGEPQPALSVLYVRSPKFLQRASLSNASLLADIYWIRTIQYYGGTRRDATKQKNYDLLYPLLDIVTALDPHFTIAYRFGAVFLAEKYPGGPGRPDLAIALLEKGVKAEANKWQYDLDEGFVYYWYLHDYEKAAAAFERGAEVSHAPWWLRSLAALTSVKGGDRQSSRMLWRQLYETADNAWLRNNAQMRLLQLDALDQIDELERIVREVARRTGRAPTSWRAMIDAGWIRGFPLDPSGAPYLLDPATGRVNVSEDSKLYPLPTEPNVLVAPGK